MEHPSSNTTIKPGSYSPQFLNPKQYAILTRLTDIILPPDSNNGDISLPEPCRLGVRNLSISCSYMTRRYSIRFELA